LIENLEHASAKVGICVDGKLPSVTCGPT
jgi:hypothetical protein